MRRTRPTTQSPCSSCTTTGGPSWTTAGDETARLELYDAGSPVEGDGDEVTPKLLADIAADVTDTLVRNEEARRQHWIGKNLLPPDLKDARTPWSAR